MGSLVFETLLLRKSQEPESPVCLGGEPSQRRDGCLEGVGRLSRGEQARLPSPSPKRQGLDLGVQATRGSFGVKKKGRSLFEYSSPNVERLPRAVPYQERHSSRDLRPLGGQWDRRLWNEVCVFGGERT